MSFEDIEESPDCRAPLRGRPVGSKNTPRPEGYSKDVCGLTDAMESKISDESTGMLVGHTRDQFLPPARRIPPLSPDADVNTFEGIRREMSRVYREVRDGTLDENSAGRMIYILQSMLKAVEAEVKERQDSGEHFSSVSREEAEEFFSSSSIEEGVVSDD